MWKSRFIRNEFSIGLKDYIEDGSYIRDIAELWNQIQYVFPSDRFGQSQKMKNDFALIGADP